MRPREYDIDPVAVDPDGISEASTLSAGGAQALPIDGALASGGAVTLDYARQILITSVGNDSGITLTIVGTDADGLALTEVVTGPNATTAESAGYFKTVSSITASGDTAADISAGTVDELSTKTIQLDDRSSAAAAVAVNVTGTIDYTVQITFEPLDWHLGAGGKSSQNLDWHNVTALTTKTADLYSALTAGATAVRLIVNSYTATAEIQMHVSHPHGT